MAQAAEHGGQAQTRCGHVGDLPGGQEVGPGAEHAEHRIVHMRSLSHRGGVRHARVLERAADGRPDRLGDRGRNALPICR